MGGVFISKLDLLYLVLYFFVCADAGAVAVNMLEFLEVSILLIYLIYKHKRLAMSETAFERLKTHGKACAAHFNVALSYGPKTAESLVGVG